MNSPGSWKCICSKGWYPEPKDARLPTCKDVNECVDVPNSCPVQSVCVNTAGSYRCNCLAGWRNQGLHACSDINECSEGSYSCPSNSRCVNTQGSYQCHCNSGFSPPVTTSVCNDVNECATGSHSCSSYGNAYCVNTVGSYTCRCNRCYFMSGNQCKRKYPYNLVNLLIKAISLMKYLTKIVISQFLCSQSLKCGLSPSLFLKLNETSLL